MGGGGGERERGDALGLGEGGYETTQVYAIEKQLMGTVRDVQCLHTQACRTQQKQIHKSLLPKTPVKMS